MRSVAIPDNLKYLYNERPSSPSIGTGGANASGSGVQYANAQASSVPVLANPLPRSTSLHRLGRKKSGDALDGAKKAEDDADSGKPTLANIDTRAPASTSPLTPAQLSIPTPTSASASSVTRKPPPRRKPPLPVETEGETNNAVAFPSQASEAADASTERSGATNENYGQGNMARSRAEYVLIANTLLSILALSFVCCRLTMLLTDRQLIQAETIQQLHFLTSVIPTPTNIIRITPSTRHIHRLIPSSSIPHMSVSRRVRANWRQIRTTRPRYRRLH